MVPDVHLVLRGDLHERVYPPQSEESGVFRRGVLISGRNDGLFVAYVVLTVRSGAPKAERNFLHSDIIGVQIVVGELL